MSYLDYFGLDVGYMLSFSFNRRKEPGMRRITVGDKVVWRRRYSAQRPGAPSLEV